MTFRTRIGPVGLVVGLLLAGLALDGCTSGSTGQSPKSVIEPTGNQIGFAVGGPNMQVLGRRDGSFAVANRSNWWQPAFSVDAFSRLDQIWPAHRIAKGPEVSPWLRAAKAPEISYVGNPRNGPGRFSLRQYLERNPATGLLIAREGTILFEQYQYGRRDTQRLTSFSMAKTITAMLIGIAIEEGHIRSIDDTADSYVPDLSGTEYGRTPLRHLLTMSSGVAFREEYDGKDDSALLSRNTLGGQTGGGALAVVPFNTRYAAPGAVWNYASAETYVLGLVLRNAIGRSVAEYLSEKIWQPMGAEADATWVVDRSGQELGHTSFNAVLRDYARFGMLLANGGRAGEKQLIPEAWLKLATQAHFPGEQTYRWFGYGFQTWIFPDGSGCFAMLGVRGQSIFIDPVKKLVLVHTAVRSEARDPGGADLTALWRALRAAL